jgi:hypothetical protein
VLDVIGALNPSLGYSVKPAPRRMVRGSFLFVRPIENQKLIVVNSMDLIAKKQTPSANGKKAMSALIKSGKAHSEQMFCALPHVRTLDCAGDATN